MTSSNVVYCATVGKSCVLAMAGVVLLDVVRSVLKLETSSTEANLQESLTGLTVRHLKDLCSELQVKTSGTKAVLIGELVTELMAALVESRGCPCTDDKEYLESSHFRCYGLPVLRILHSVKHILNEEECKSVGKAGVCWDDELAIVIVVKGAVQETLGVLEEYKKMLWYGRAAKGIKMLLELYQEKLVTEDEVKRMKGKEVYLSDRVVLVQFTKPPEVVARSVIVLDKYGHNEEANQLRVLSELYQEKLVTEDEVKKMKGEGGFLPDRVVLVQCTKPPEVVARTVHLLDKYGHKETARWLRVLNELFTRHLLTAEECSQVARKKRWEDHLNQVLSTKPAEVVQEACQVLEKHGCRVEEKLKTLNELFTRHFLTAEECSEVAGKGLWWEDHLDQVLLTKPAEVVEEACQVLEKHGLLVKKKLKTLNELFTRHLLTAEECSEVARKESWEWEDHLNQVLLTKPAEVVQEACQVMEKHGCQVEEELETLNELFTRHLLTAEECSEVAGKRRWEWEDHLDQVLLTKPAEVVLEACQVLEKHGCQVEEELKRRAAPMTHRWVPDKHLGLRGDLEYGGSSTVSSDLGYGGSSTVSSDLGYGGSSTVSSDLGYGGSSTAATSTHSSSHLVERYQKMSMHPLAEERYQKMSMHPLAEGPSLSQTELSSEEVEEESKHQGSKVPSGPAGEGSGPPREPDSATVKGAEAALVDLCWIPFGIQSQSVGPEGGKLSLEPSAGAIGEEEGGTILLEVPPGAVSPAESVEIRSGLIPDGPFTLPEGYQLGSMVVYLYYDGHRLTKPCTLSLPHWYGGEDQVRDGLSFAMAPHTLKEGESVYHFELLEGGRFAEQQQCGVLQISGHCTLFAAVFKVKASSLYYASLWTHQVGGAVIADNAMESKVVITYAALVWIKVLKKYWKDWKRHPSDPPVQFKFSGKKVQGVLSEQSGEGWEASLKGTGKVHSSKVAYHGNYSKKDLESAVKEHVYPPAIHCVVMYESPPDCSRGVKMNKLSIEGTKTGERIDFPFKVYKVKTPHPPSSPSASASSSMGGCPSLPSPVDTDDEATQFSASEFLKKYETGFFEVVEPRLSLLRLVRKGVITEDVRLSIYTSNTDDAREVLYHHLAHHANVDTLKEYLRVAIAADGYPKMQSLGRKMMEELEQGGEQTH